ncbi:hypothetical protein JXB12_05235 [candidate division KSB1 bacterium]|nr:hypothetical protein [candidate division KSB1 bacterium]
MTVTREIFPEARSIGIIWNPAEVCSEACTYQARVAAERYDFELIEATVSDTGEIMDAIKSLLDKRSEWSSTSGDRTIIIALATIARILNSCNISINMMFFRKT